MKALPWREGLFKPLLSRLQESPPSSSLLVSILLMTRILLVSKRICVFSPPVSSTRMPLPEIPLPLFLLLELSLLLRMIPCLGCVHKLVRKDGLGICYRRLTTSNRSAKRCSRCNRGSRSCVIRGFPPLLSCMPLADLGSCCRPAIYCAPAADGCVGYCGY